VNQVLARTNHRDAFPRMAAITVASHRDAKNYPNLLRAVRTAVDSGAALGLLAIGDGAGLDAHRAMVHELDLDHVVRFEPPTELVLDRIAESDVLVVASDYEGQPIVVAEALALGKPVIATAVGRVPEMVNPAVGRVVAPKDPIALGAALTELAGSPETRAAMSKAAREQGLGWTLDDVLDAHQALYRQVIGQQTR
jgi:glycosyltransferase involved in cell wall biosynthesis